MSSQQPPSERGIPLLTEVLAAAPDEPTQPADAVDSVDFPESALLQQADLPHAHTPAQWPTAAAAAPAMDEEAHWRQLAQDIHEQVLQQLLGQVNSLLQQQVAEQMAIAFEHVTQQLTAQIQVNLEQALQQSVRLAVEQEIEKTRMTQNKGF